MPTIKGAANFSGIALIDTDVYIPGGKGNEWYINQNQFYRQIRNFVIDLRGMPRSNVQGGQTYVPTGIHWQVAQATSLQNIDFVMPVSDSSGSTTAVGIFIENVSHLLSKVMDLFLDLLSAHTTLYFPIGAFAN